jgi:hypothetical protein
VFISSATDEFSELRYKLRDSINSEYMFNDERTQDEEEIVHQGIIMEGFLVEKESGESFDAAMKEGIESSQIYVGIFGNRYSEPTVKEYEAARKIGIPLLVYYFTRPAHRAAGLQTRAVKFLEREVKPFVKIRGNYSRIVARQNNELVDYVLADLAAKVTDLVRESVAVRRMVLENAPVELLAAVLRAKRSVFE